MILNLDPSHSNAIQGLCFMYTAFRVISCSDSIIPKLAISKVSRLQLVSVAEQASLSLTWSQTPKTGFLVTWLMFQWKHCFNLQLNEKFKEEDNPSVIYAISMSWFKEWENFVRGKIDGMLSSWYFLVS